VSAANSLVPNFDRNQLPHLPFTSILYPVSSPAKLTVASLRSTSTYSYKKTASFTCCVNRQIDCSLLQTQSYLPLSNLLESRIGPLFRFLWLSGSPFTVLFAFPPRAYALCRAKPRYLCCCLRLRRVTRPSLDTAAWPASESHCWTPA
jgi:hypothetical protein